MPEGNHPVRPGRSTSSSTVALDRFVERGRRLVGDLAPDVQPGVDVASWLHISRFVEATGDENPLYTDVRYGAGSTHYTMLAPPTFVLAVRLPDSAAGLDRTAHRLARTVRALQLVWNDQIRLADPLRGRVSVDDVSRAAASVRVRSAIRYERNGFPLAGGWGELSLVARSDNDARFAERSIHRYSDEEIEELIGRLEAEPPPRGDVPRFWNDTAPGDRLPELLKGPLTFSDLFVWKVAAAQTIPGGNLRHRELLELQGRRSVHPVTGWPVWDRAEAWSDSATAAEEGLPAPVAHGGLVTALAGQLVTHWMGDDAFLRRLTVRLLRPLFYGDTLTLAGRVAERLLATDEAGQTYQAVLVELTGKNQLDDLVMEGEAVVFLPEPGKPVLLPVHGEIQTRIQGAE